MENSVSLIGRLGTEIEARTFGQGKKVVSFRLATTERWKKDGEWQERTTWHTVETFIPGLIKFLEEHVGKGALLRVVGSLKYDQFTNKDGVEVQAAKIAVKDSEHKILKLAEARGSD